MQIAHCAVEVSYCSSPENGVGTTAAASTIDMSPILATETSIDTFGSVRTGGSDGSGLASGELIVTGRISRDLCVINYYV